MKNMLKRLVLIIISCCLILGTVGCGRDDGNVVINKKETQLYVGYYDGGLKDEWMKILFSKFEQKYAEHSFEEGKKGVQIVPMADKNFDGRFLSSKIASSGADIFFTESVPYYDLISKNLIMDITDTVQETCEEFDLNGDGVAEKLSIEDKMEESIRDTYKIDGKYYGLPFYDGYYGLIYDVDLFEDKKFYFKEGGGFCTEATDVKTVGIDGKKGTHDDGLPVLYKDFIQLLSKIKSTGAMPLIWTGQYKEYISNFLIQVWADYEGREKMMRNATFSGNTDIVDTITDDTFTTKQIDISNQNGLELQRQPGKYYALKFAKEILTGSGNYSPMSVGITLSHTQAQEQYLDSKFNNEKDTIAMLIDGSWWEMEAAGVFNDMSEPYEYGEEASKKNRKFGIMPLPKYNAEKANEPSSFVAIDDSLCFINNASNTKSKEIAKLFMKFCHTNEALSIFNRVTSVTRSFDYIIPENDLKEMSYYGVQNYEFAQSGQLIRLGSKNRMWLENSSYFDLQDSWAWTANISRTTYTNPVEYFRDNPSAKIETYFDGLYNQYESIWTPRFNKYF